jgi:uncharacterized protein YxjI
MREKVLSIGDDCWIEDDSGQKVFKVNGKALPVRKTLIFESPDGVELCRIQERKLRVRDSMEIEGPDGERLAMVMKAMVTPLRERWTAEMATAGSYACRATSSTMSTGSSTRAPRSLRFSMRWFRVRDTYGIGVAPGQPDIFVLAVAVAVDAMARGRKSFDHGPAACCSSRGGSP